MNESISTATPAVGSPAASAPSTPTKRVMALDALRGFDMFWIVGGEEIVHALAKALPFGAFLVLDRQMDHKPWSGLAFYDLIFPLFVFIVGVSLVFSLSRAIEKGGKAAAIRRMLFRGVLLYVFGLLVYGGISKGLENVRWMGVLQRIAICYFVAGVLFCSFRIKGLITVCLALLVGYWALVTFVPIRDFNLKTSRLEALNLTPRSPETRVAFLGTTNWVRGKFDDGRNLPQHLDFQYLPGYKWDGAYDPEGLLSTLPAMATCLLGVFAGLLLRNSDVPDQKKVIYLLGAGLMALAAAFLWNLQFPIIKKIWSSSYVLAAAGYASLFLGVFYYVVEVVGWRKWCLPFIWIGMNPITMYLLWNFVEYDKIAKKLVGGPVQAFFGAWGELLLALVAAALMFATVRFLYNRKIFLRL
jgi:predicted acyltransferase